LVCRLLCVSSDAAKSRVPSGALVGAVTDTQNDLLDTLGLGNADSNDDHSLPRYAETHFDCAIRKKGLFGGSKTKGRLSATEISALTTFTSTGIDHPLHPIPTQASQKEAVLIFNKGVLAYLSEAGNGAPGPPGSGGSSGGGGSSSKGSPMLAAASPPSKKGSTGPGAAASAPCRPLTRGEGAAMQLTRRAWESRELRDEIICQALRQTRGNPSVDGERQAWRLVALILTHVSPSETLQPTLRHFLASTIRKASPRSWHHAVYCATRQRKIMREYQLPGRIPLPPTEESVIFASSVDTTSFGHDLETLMYMQRGPSGSGGDGLDVPRILRTVTDRLRSMNALVTEGLFRIPGAEKEVQAARESIIRGDFSFTFESPHTYAGLLKIWLRELSEPVFPPNDYNTFMAATTSAEDVIASLARLPRVNRAMLHDLASFLKEVQAHEDVNKMSTDNLALVFAPTLFQGNLNDASAALLFADKERRFVSLILASLHLFART
jgi:hypothetical protein